MNLIDSCSDTSLFNLNSSRDTQDRFPSAINVSKSTQDGRDKFLPTIKEEKKSPPLT
jgi:hypothetical protein